VLVLAGAITEMRDAETQTYGPSTLLYRPACEPHAYAVSQAGARCLIVDADDGWLARARVHAPVVEQSTSFRGGFLIHLAHRLHGEFRLRDDVSRLVIESITLGVLAEASRRVAKTRDASPNWLQQARALAEAHFAEPLSLSGVARKVGVHPVHLARTFRRVHRITFAGYVRQVRIEFARRELAASSAPLGDIAAAAGFCDQSHFSRLFKRHTGLTPAAYRLALQTR
jgi:AraC family transcriptional regulator